MKKQLLSALISAGLAVSSFGAALTASGAEAPSCVPENLPANVTLYNLQSIGATADASEKSNTGSTDYGVMLDDDYNTFFRPHDNHMPAVTVDLRDSRDISYVATTTYNSDGQWSYIHSVMSCDIYVSDVAPTDYNDLPEEDLVFTGATSDAEDVNLWRYSVFAQTTGRYMTIVPTATGNGRESSITEIAIGFGEVELPSYMPEESVAGLTYYRNVADFPLRKINASANPSDYNPDPNTYACLMDGTSSVFWGAQVNYGGTIDIDLGKAVPLSFLASKPRSGDQAWVNTITAIKVYISENEITDDNKADALVLDSASLSGVDSSGWQYIYFPETTGKYLKLEITTGRDFTFDEFVFGYGQPAVDLPEVSGNTALYNWISDFPARSVNYAFDIPQDAPYAIDGSAETVWKQADFRKNCTIVIDLGKEADISYFASLPRQSEPNTHKITDCEIYISKTAPEIEISDDVVTGNPAAEDLAYSGALSDITEAGEWQSAHFDTKTGRYVTLIVNSTATGREAAVSEIVLGYDKYTSEELVILQKLLLGSSSGKTIDVNNDGDMNIKDLIALKKLLSSPVK